MMWVDMSIFKFIDFMMNTIYIIGITSIVLWIIAFIITTIKKIRRR